MDPSIILFDVNMRDKDLALKTLMKISCKKFFTETKDVTKLILFNTEETDNYMNARYGGYEHISECFAQIMRYNPELFYELIHRAEPTNKGNWVEALTVGVNRVLDDLIPVMKTTSYQLLFITDFGQDVTDYDQERFQSIIDTINTHHIYLYVLGPHIPVPYPIQEYDDVKRWMSETSFADHEINLSLFKRILDGTCTSVVCDLKIGYHLFSSFKNFPGARPWTMPLSTGSIDFPAQTYRIFREGVVCKLLSTQRSNTAIVWVDFEDETIEYPREDIIKGISRHDRIVVIPDPDMFNCESSAGFHILCFTDSKNVPEYFMQGEGSYLVFPSGTEEEKEAMNMLIDHLAHRKKYAIARRVYADFSTPTIVVLVPSPEHNPPCFIYAELPVADDILVEYKEQDPKTVPSIKVDPNIEAFLNAIDVDNPKNAQVMPLGMQLMNDINTDKLINKAADKLLSKDLKLGDGDLDYVTGLASTSKFEAIEEMWPKREVKEIKNENDPNASPNADSEDDEYD